MPRLNFAGHLNSNSSIGKAARDNVKAMSLTLDLDLNELPLSDNGDDGNYFSGNSLSQDNPAPVNFMHFNPDQVPRLKTRFGQDYFRGKKNIGFWIWETNSVLETWKLSVGEFDEIWTASDYCANTFKSAFNTTVKVLPHLVDPVKPSEADRDSFGIPTDKFVFYFAFDAWSRYSRKNPEGLIEAFRIVVDRHPDSMLVVKSRHMEPRDKERIFGSFDQSKLLFINEFLSEPDLNALTTCCDCFVSLHRSEGFGLHIAEAMALGVPVVATGYSGNMQFMRYDNSFPVKFDLIDIQDDYFGISGGQWAEPDINDAARRMIEVIRNPIEARQRAKKASEFIKSNHSAEALSKIALSNLLE